MRIIPRTVQRLITQSTDAQRVGDALTATVQPTLDFLNTFFLSAQDGSLQVKKNTTFQSVVTFLGNAAVAGVATVGSLVASGAVTAASFVSPSGFKNSLDGGTFAHYSVTAATLYQHQRVSLQTNAMSTSQIQSQNLVQPMPFAGSVVAIAYQYQGSSTQTITIQVAKNNASLWNYPSIAVGAVTGALGYKPVAKGTYPFVAGDFLTVLSSYSATGQVELQVTLFIEMMA